MAHGLELEIAFRRDTDSTIKFRHDEGNEENMNIGRLVKAYADTMGIHFQEITASDEERFRGNFIDKHLYFKVLSEDGKKYLVIHGFRLDLPDVNKTWGIAEATQIWTGIDYLMKM